MNISRRYLMTWFAMLAIPAKVLGGKKVGPDKKYGLIGKILAIPGRREDLSKVLIEGVAGMPGCISYIVANDLSDEDALWITEVWMSQDKHRESLQLASVQAAITKGKPLISGFGERFETQPLGGTGI